jgi:hypothetical protein
MSDFKVGWQKICYENAYLSYKQWLTSICDQVHDDHDTSHDNHDNGEINWRLLVISVTVFLGNSFGNIFLVNFLKLVFYHIFNIRN